MNDGVVAGSSPATPGMSRRSLLVAGGLVGVGLVAGACGGSGKGRAGQQTVITAANTLQGDLAIVALLASLENLLVSVYQDGLDRSGKLGPYPPSMQTMLTGAQAQHRQHAMAWNNVLSSAGKPGITGVDLTVKASTTDPEAQRAKDVTGLLTTCFDAETLVATTYLAAIGAIGNVAAVKIAASIHPVENEHVAVLNFLLGHNVNTDSFGRADGARTTTDGIG